MDTRGIGLATVKSLLEQNAVVVALSRSSPPELVQLVGAHKDSLTTFQCDVFVLLSRAVNYNKIYHVSVQTKPKYPR